MKYAEMNLTKWPKHFSLVWNEINYYVGNSSPSPSPSIPLVKLIPAHVGGCQWTANHPATQKAPTQEILGMESGLDLGPDESILVLYTI